MLGLMFLLRLLLNQWLRMLSKLFLKPFLRLFLSSVLHFNSLAGSLVLKDSQSCMNKDKLSLEYSSRIKKSLWIMIKGIIGKFG